MVTKNISKDWSELFDEGFNDMWSIGGFLIVFIFCTIIISLTLAIIFCWCCGWCCEIPTWRSNKIGVLVSPSEQQPIQTQTELNSVQTQTGLKSILTQTGLKSIQTQTGLRSIQTKIGLRSIKTQTGLRSIQTQTGLRSTQTQTSLSNLSGQIHTQSSMKDRHNSTESVLKPASLPDVPTTKESSKNKTPKVRSVKMKRTHRFARFAVRIARNRDLPV
ncbi:hypothetical protein UPYG_G00017410 [Umbra pygmaea]|uniref:Uncharacterized protein n=1 Tax=Umbra pygmaea TaxID=75934 RepID=A0ABD0Y918_UMBPY